MSGRRKSISTKKIERFERIKFSYEFSHGADPDDGTAKVVIYRDRKSGHAYERCTGPYCYATAGNTMFFAGDEDSIFYSRWSNNGEDGWHPNERKRADSPGSREYLESGSLFELLERLHESEAAAT